MKRLLYTFLTISPVAAIAQANNPPATVSGNTTGVTFFLLVYIFILLLLVMWLVRKGLLLKETAKMEEPEGKDWLNAHLNELDNTQLDTLISRSSKANSRRSLNHQSKKTK